MIADIATLINQCTIPTHKVVMQAIVKIESGYNPLAIGLNKGFKLKFQPKDETQAKLWVEYLDKHGYNFDVGLAQINIKNIHKYGYAPSDMLNPCTNLIVGSTILDKNYQAAIQDSATTSEALQKAISAYNTGNYSAGFYNGYVDKVNAHLGDKVIASNDISDPNIPPIINLSSSDRPDSLKTVPVSKDDAGKLSTTGDNPKHSKNSWVSTKNPYSAKTVMYVQPKIANKQELADAQYKAASTGG